MFAAKSSPIPLSRDAILRTADSPYLLTVSRVPISCNVVSPRISGVRERKFGTFLSAVGQDGRLQGLDESPLSVELETIEGESQFNRVIAEAQQLDESVIVVWMASWCRKCIYLKPKLQKLAADYYPRLRFYCIDVNKVPHSLVARAGVTYKVRVWSNVMFIKPVYSVLALLIFFLMPDMAELGKHYQKMPTIQLWKDSNKQEEVIGGHKAYLVVNEVREMIENEHTS